MALLVVMLLLGLALLAIVDSQTDASARDQRASSSYNGAESVLRGAVTSLGSQDGWVNEFDTNNTACGGVSYTAATTHGTTFGTRLQEFVTRALGSSAGTWKVNICGMTSASESWSETYLTSRVPHSTSTVPNSVWVRAQTTTQAGTRKELRATVARADLRLTPTPLPNEFAIAAGALGTEDVATTTGVLLSSGVQKAILEQILGGGETLIEDDDAKLGVRCGLLNLLPDPDSNNEALCLAGTLASAGDFANLVVPAGDQLTGLLGLDRFVQLPSYQSATNAQLEALELEAKRRGTYYATVGNGADCLPATTDATSVIYIAKVANGNGTDHCKIQTTGSGTSAAGRTAAILVVEQGGVDVIGNDSATTAPTFTGTIYAANKVSPQPAGSGDTLVRLSRRGWVRGAIFADGQGKVSIDPPDVSVTTALCNLLGPLQKLTCQLLSGLGLVDYLINALGVNGLVNALLPQLNNYTAVDRNTDEELYQPKVPTSAEIGGSTFRQIAPN
ncbi:MAG TPA: hypothetical protein VFZ89_11935 [Solirubrobacteraceae bacterium]